MKCEICKFELNLQDNECGYFEEQKKIYCEKCYANKRFGEIKDKENWLANVQNLINTDSRTYVVMRKIPTEWESLLNKEKVKKVRDKWKKMNWTV